MKNNLQSKGTKHCKTEHKVSKKFSCTLYLIKFEVAQSMLRRLSGDFSVEEFRRQKLSYESVKLHMIWMHRSSLFWVLWPVKLQVSTHVNLCLIQFKRAYLNVSVEHCDSRQGRWPDVPEIGVICLTPNYHNLTTFSHLKAVKLCTWSAQSMNS